MNTHLLCCSVQCNSVGESIVPLRVSEQGRQTTAMLEEFVLSLAETTRNGAMQQLCCAMLLLCFAIL